MQLSHAVAYPYAMQVVVLGGPTRVSQRNAPNYARVLMGWVSLCSRFVVSVVSGVSFIKSFVKSISVVGLGSAVVMLTVASVAGVALGGVAAWGNDSLAVTVLSLVFRSFMVSFGCGCGGSDVSTACD